ncbi:hypothetical protein A6S26_32355 [Nostoc sp. ATCC 43529]|nr:hypothetical protein A6S26_32355 [Nostoc sp. ATCC 43529]
MGQQSEFSIIIAVISLALSFIVAYFAYLSPSKPRMLVSRYMIFFHNYWTTSSGDKWGGISFYLPITFYNWSPKGGSIFEVRLIIGRQDDPTKYFDISWAYFVQILQEQSRWENENVAQPIAISGQSSVSKVIRFDWSPNMGEKIDIEPGQYKLLVLAWTRDTAKPNLRDSISFVITREQSEQYQKYVEHNNNGVIEVPLGETNRSNNVLTVKQIDRFYG